MTITGLAEGTRWLFTWTCGKERTILSGERREKVGYSRRSKSVGSDRQYPACQFIINSEWDEIDADSPITQSGSRQISRFAHDRSVIHAKRRRPKNIVCYCFASPFTFELFFYLREIVGRAFIRRRCAMYECYRWIFHRRNSPAARSCILMPSVS